MTQHRCLAGWYFAYFAFIGTFLPFFSLYLESIALSPSEIGVLMSLGQIMRMIVPAFWGWLSDRSGHRTPIVRWSALLSLVCFGGYFFTRDFLGLLAATLLLHLFWSAALPLVEALTFAHLRDEPGRYGRIRLWGSIGFIVAVLSVGALLDSQPMAVLLWCGWLMLGLVCLVAYSLREAVAVVSHATSSPLGHWREPRVLALLAAGFFMAAAHGPLYVFYSIHLVDHGYSKSMTGMLWSLGVVAEIGVFLLMPRLSRWFSLKAILLVSFAVAVLRFLMIGWWIDSLTLVLIAQLFHGATFGSHHAATVAALNQWFAPAQQGRIQAMYGSFSFGAGGMLGALLAGQMWQNDGAGWTYSMASIFALLGLLVVWRGLPASAATTGPVR
jgi:PPP family 3-phenylpropionic acid transporter